MEISWLGVEVADTVSDRRGRLLAEGVKVAPGAPEGNLDARTLPSRLLSRRRWPRPLGCPSAPGLCSDH
jgi:hypothetical protein